MGRILFHVVALVALVTATVSVPMPLTQLGPGPAREIPALFAISGTQITELDGETLLLTIVFGQPTLAETVTALLDEDRELRIGSSLVPGVNEEEYIAAEQTRFERALELAVAVGAREAGHDVTLDTAAFVAAIGEDAPARGDLEPGDLVLAVEGAPVAAANELIAAFDDIEVGETVTLTVRRDDERREVDVTTGMIEVRGERRAGLGVFVETIVADVSLPFELSREETSIGGPSAGLMVALTTYDILARENLLAGRTVAGTGEIQPDGSVGSVGGVEEKVVGAARNGADVLLVPAEQADAAHRAAPDGVEVVGVASLAEAVEALAGDG